MKTRRNIALAAVGVVGVLAGLALQEARGASALLVPSGDKGKIIWFDGMTGKYVKEFVTSGSGGLQKPTGITFGPDGSLYVADYNLNVVKRYNGHNGAYMGDFSSSRYLSGPTDLVFGPDGNLYVSGSQSGNLVRYNGASGAFIDVFIPHGAGGLSEPGSALFGPENTLLVSDAKSGVLRFNAKTGAYIDKPVPASTNLAVADAMTLGPDGSLYIADRSGDKVFRYKPTTGQLTLFAQIGIGRGPNGLAFGPDGDLYISSTALDSVTCVDSATGGPRGIFASGNGLSSPGRIMFLVAPTLRCEYRATGTLSQEGTLTFTWNSPMHQLQAQVSDSGSGGTTGWIDVPGGTKSPVSVPLDRNLQSVFYRLVWP